MASGSEGLGGIADKEAYTVHTTNISSQRQCFEARYLSSYVGNVFWLSSLNLGRLKILMISTFYVMHLYLVR
jgi:hypothetical protein